MKVRYKSKDGTYESTAEVGDIFTEFDGYDMDGVDTLTDEHVVLVATSTGWQEI
jgi:hypothetical protein